MSAPQWCFDRFRLDPAQACLWHDREAVALPPKAFGVLHHLLTHPDRLVTKDELLAAVWPATAVSEAVVRMAIGALRKALGDSVQAPRFIATVSRRGYRFLAPVTLAGSACPAPAPALSCGPAPVLVEREAVLQQLQTHLAQAQQGTRQLVVVTGEAGISCGITSMAHTT